MRKVILTNGITTDTDTDAELAKIELAISSIGPSVDITFSAKSSWAELRTKCPFLWHKQPKPSFVLQLILTCVMMNST